MVHIPKEDFLVLQKGQSLLVSELRKLLGNILEIDWSYVLTFVQKFWRTLSEAMAAIQSINGNP